ncbi:hypothetical protein LBW62_25015, partial [Ralstonia solanacearum]|nr:hypothetical protein [Ralstonia solanacearum]MDB0559425.1 hypothetical protein [Ralstonia solanacearum]
MRRRFAWDGDLRGRLLLCASIIGTANGSRKSGTVQERCLDHMERARAAVLPLSLSPYPGRTWMADRGFGGNVRIARRTNGHRPQPTKTRPRMPWAVAGITMEALNHALFLWINAP